MKIRRSLVVLFVISTLIIPLSLYRSMYSANASDEFQSTIGIISHALMIIFLLLAFSFSLFTDDFPHSYTSKPSRGLGLLAVLLAGAAGYTSLLGLISEEYALFPGTSGKVLAGLGILSVLTFMFYAVTFFKGENMIPSVAAVPLFPALWYGLRMLLCFLKSASMADIRSEMAQIAMCCSFTIFTLTIGKLFCGISSHSIKWGFATGCVGVMTTFIYTLDWIVNDCKQMTDLLTFPTLFVDLLMALFTIGTLFHVSAPAEYFDDEQWDDYYYENYDLPKPSLLLHTPVDELENDGFSDSGTLFIPQGVGVSGTGNRTFSEDLRAPSDSGQSYYTPPQPTYSAPQQPQNVPSYIANPAAYYGSAPQQSMPQQGAYYPPSAPQAPYYPPTYPTYPAYPVYPAYPSYPMDNDYYGQPPMAANPYDTATAQYQYERRRADLQNRELEKLTGEVDSSIARLGNTVAQQRPPSNEYVSASPDEHFGGTPQSSGVNVRLNQGYVASGQRLTDQISRMEEDKRQRTQQDYGEDEYTYEYYYPTEQTKYDLRQFHPKQ